jgi:S-adenosylmethionine:tRNA ribosyltransferase-isomerase
LHLDGRTGRVVDRQFRDVLEWLKPGDVMVFNNTEVVKARLHGAKASGGRVEALIERVLTGGFRASAHVRASKSPKPGSRIVFGDAEAIVEGRDDDLFILRFAEQVYALMARLGELPLPPYIAHPPDVSDESRYQTVYAEVPGSVAAPTAGLHFDEAMLDAIRRKAVEATHVTLHVGAGTFAPVRVGDISSHTMHSEWFEVSEAAADTVNRAKKEGRRIIAVGTTSLRTLESAAVGGHLTAKRGDTRLFVTPGFRFQMVDRLITNLHLPKSTLMMLVSAFAGTANIRRAYAHAVNARYRFFSYGDAMLIERAD